ncbi:MAG: hypothetical protein SFU25_06010, partial [Candidatus Caenarcaniphilales bacterium]|nr:hypothetical protein [Candidatus Caenarcaniphilales bacterium]
MPDLKQVMGFPPLIPISRNLFPSNPALPTSLNGLQKTKPSNISEKVNKDKIESSGSGVETEQHTLKNEKEEKVKKIETSD